MQKGLVLQLEPGPTAEVKKDLGQKPDSHIRQLFFDTPSPCAEHSFFHNLYILILLLLQPFSRRLVCKEEESL